MEQNENRCFTDGCQGTPEHGKTLICKESRRGSGNLLRVGGVAIKVVKHMVLLVINFYTYSAMKYKTEIVMGIVQLLT